MSSDQTAAREEEMALAAKLPQADASSLVDREVLEAQVQDMYRQVARGEDAQLHFAIGQGLALRVGYPSELLDAIPEEALASFAGVGYHLDLAKLLAGRARARSRLGLRDRCVLRSRAGRPDRARRWGRLHGRADREGSSPARPRRLRAGRFRRGEHRRSTVRGREPSTR